MHGSNIPQSDLLLCLYREGYSNHEYATVINNPSSHRALRIDTGDLGVNGGACFIHLIILYSIRYLLGVIRWTIINPFY